MTITLYSKPACQQCVATERRLKANEVTFVHDDALANVDMLKDLGHLSAPVVLVHDGETLIDHWSGYRPDKIDELVLV